MPTKKSKASQKVKKSEPVSRKRAGSFVSQKTRKRIVSKSIFKKKKTTQKKTDVFSFFSFFKKIQKKKSIFHFQTKNLRSVKKKFPHFTETQKTVFLAILGCNLLIGGALYLSYKKTVLSFQVIPVSSAETEPHTNLPVEVIIPSVQISLPIVETKITDGVWFIPPVQVGHLSASAFPGERSNMVLYAHNRRELFANLHDVKQGDEVIVRTNRGADFRYKVTEIMVVTPDEIDVVLPTDYEELTLYTCTGFLDSKRLVVKAEPFFE